MLRFFTRPGWHVWAFGTLALLGLGGALCLALPHQILCESKGPNGLDWVSLDGQDVRLQLRPSCGNPMNLRWDADGSLLFWKLDDGALVAEPPRWGQFRLREEGGVARLEMRRDEPESLRCWPHGSVWPSDFRGPRSLADAFLQLGWASAILLGLLLGTGFSLLEASSTRRLAGARTLTSVALAARLLACLGLALLCAAERDWAQPVPLRGVGVAAALAFGQLFAASIVALRASDVPRGWIRSAPGHGFVLGAALVPASAIFALGGPDASISMDPVPLFLFATWAPLWVAAPVVLHSALPRFLKAGVRRAGLGVALLAAAQCVPGDRAARMTHVFDGVRLWTRRVAAALWDGGAPGAELLYLMGASLFLSLAALVIDVRRERPRRSGPGRPVEGARARALLKDS